MLDIEKYGNPIRNSWNRLSGLPGGKTIFSKLIGRVAPYTGTIDPQVVEVRPGYARVQMRDRRAVRNHLKSIHAIALMNLAEVCSGVAMMYCIPDDARGILSGLSIDYIKKGRGTLTAETELDPPSASTKQEYEVVAVIKDDTGDVVARARAKWLIGPKRAN